MIAHFCPGFGNPWRMTLAQWFSALGGIEELRDLTMAPADHLEVAMRMVRKKERNERRLKNGGGYQR